MKNTIVLLGFVQSLFGLSIFITKRPKHLSFYLLGMWMLVIAIFLGAQMLPFEVVNYFNPGIFPLLFLFGPLLFLYVCSLAIENFNLKRIHLVHLIPLVAISLHRSVSDPLPISTFFRQNSIVDFTNNTIYFILLIISLFVYWILSVKVILNHRKKIPFYFSNYTRRNTLNWLIFVILFFLLFFLADFFMSFLSKIYDFRNPPIFSLHNTLTIFTFIILFFGINQTVIYKENNKKKGHYDEMDDKYKRSGIEKSRIDEINIKVYEYLNNKKPYLNANFNFQTMADDLEIPRQTLSQVINIGQKKNFYQLINEFRIAEVKEKLSKKEYKHLTVLGIAFECGFNSKTTFNRIFKEETGLTPTQYIKKL